MSENQASAQVTAYNTMPVGTVVSFGGSDVPNGWLLCDGRSIERSDYPNLYDVVGGVLPDLRSRFVVGAGQGSGLSSYPLNAQGGEERVQLSAEEMPSHQHFGWGENHSDWPYGVTGDNNNLGAYGNDYDNYLYGTTSAGGDQAHENRPPFFALTFIIKY
ncbi:MAG: tail fiber protein [Bacteroidota bacterium]